MKSTAIIAMLLFASGTCAAATDPRASVSHVKRTAIDLFAAGDSAAAIAHLQANIRPESVADGSTVALLQSLIEIACSLYNQRQTSLAREVATHAFAIGDAIVSGRSQAPVNRRAALVGGLGVICEYVLLDLKRAGELYDRAIALSPGDRLHADRKSALLQKQKTRG